MFTRWVVIPSRINSRLNTNGWWQHLKSKCFYKNVLKKIEDGDQKNPQEKVVATCEKRSWRPKQPARKGRDDQNNPQEKVVATCEKRSWRPKQPARKGRGVQNNRQEPPISWFATLMNYGIRGCPNIDILEICVFQTNFSELMWLGWIADTHYFSSRCLSFPAIVDDDIRASFRMDS